MSDTENDPRGHRDMPRAFFFAVFLVGWLLAIVGGVAASSTRLGDLALILGLVLQSFGLLTMVTRR